MFHTNGRLFKNAFGTPEMREVFNEAKYVEQFMVVEAALGRAQADLEIIPEEAAEMITETASLEYLDLDKVEQKIDKIDLFTVAIIETWKEAIGDGGEYIHYGATSQDIADTTMVLLVRDGIELLREELATIKGQLEELASEHAETPMIGRTHHVHALPITFGLKAADWLDELTRGIERLEAAAERALVVEFFGAVGSLASLGEEGLDVQKRFAKELDLAVPNTAWFASRDRFLELLNAFITIGGTASRIARQVLLLNREEIGELSEPIPEGMIGSSTMPHKRNPIMSERTVGLVALLRGHANVMGSLLENYDERDAGLWYAEYAIVPEAFLYLHRTLRNIRETLDGLGVHADAMRRNMDIHGGLVTSEAVMMALAESIGRITAHEIVHEAAMEAYESDRSFEEILMDDDRVAETLSTGELAEITDPTRYTGVSNQIVKRTVEGSRDL
ncbi:adenylosuccinate lyase [Halalkalicoccus salilacus]|uniref:adenylosuccinate lyase n=1 Tax=Halalkalicoccus salilacus TaxID=3117459 RepID=UPI00300ECB4D